MIELKPVKHHLEITDLPDLKPNELYGLFRLTRYLEPLTNRLVVMCDVKTMSAGKVIKSEIKPIGMKSSEVAEIIGCSNITAYKILRVLREKNILKRDKDLFMNPKYIRAYNGFSIPRAVALFEAPPEEQTEEDEEFMIPEAGEGFAHDADASDPVEI